MTTASMNAVTHGLFSRDTVLPTHGEDPAEYADSLDELTRDLRPQNLLERHCVQTIAAAFWRLRRFHRWEAAHAPDPTLSPDDQFQKMERAQRAEASLHRRINTALKQLGRDLPELLQTRARLLSPNNDSEFNTQICQNELPIAAIPNPPVTGGPQRSGEVGPKPPFREDPVNEVNKEVDLLSVIDTVNCQNEPLYVPIPNPPTLGGPQRSGEVGSQLDLIRAARARRKGAKGLHRV